MKWEGNERRANTRDHDLLTNINANLSNFMTRFDEHVKKDDQLFEEIKEDVKTTQKYIWMGLGGLTVVTFLLEKVFK